MSPCSIWSLGNARRDENGRKAESGFATNSWPTPSKLSSLTLTSETASLFCGRGWNSNPRQSGTPEKDFAKNSHTINSLKDSPKRIARLVSPYSPAHTRLSQESVGRSRRTLTQTVDQRNQLTGVRGRPSARSLEALPGVEDQADRHQETLHGAGDGLEDCRRPLHTVSPENL